MLDSLVSVVYLVYALCHLPGRLLVQPHQIRTAWTELQHEIIVTWVTQYPILGSHIQYRVSACEDRDVNSTSWQYADAQWKSFLEANKVQWQYLNQVIMQDLDAKCVYEYRVGSFLSMSEYYRISGVTPGAEVKGRKITYAVIGDMGIGLNSSYVRKHLHELAVRHDIDGVLHVGDIAYSLNDKWTPTADRYFNEIESFAAYAPYMVIPGNHERYDNFTQYKMRFRMPYNLSSGHTNFFYSFTLGKAHIIMYNTEAYFADDPNIVATQYNWLVDDLRQANDHREEVPWLVVLGHKPYYCTIDWRRPFEKKNWESNYDCKIRAEILRSEVEELFYEAGVDLYIAGHIHRYERTAAIYHNQTIVSDKDSFEYHLNAKAPVFLLEGSAGSRKGLDDLSTTPQDWTRGTSFEYGLGLLDICNRTHLLWTQYDSLRRVVVDRLVLEKSETRYYPDLIGS